jgi:signal transduction histidine kinase
MKRRIRILFLFIFALQPLFLSNDLSAHAKNGILDLREVSLTKISMLTLDGDWEFYWHKFLDPVQFRGMDKPVPDLFGKIPSYWTDYQLHGKSFPGQGWCTYRCIILLPRGFREKLAFDIPVFDSSFKLFINGVYAGGNGKPDTSSLLSVPEYKPFMVELNPQSDSIEVLLQVSNFEHRRGGFWKTMKFGPSHPIMGEHSRYIFFSYSSMGTLLTFSLFFFFFFLFYRKDKAPLLFSIFLAGLFIRLTCTGIYPIKLITDISWDWMIRLEYLGTYIAVIAGIWFMHGLFPLRFMRPVNIANTLILAAFCLIIPFSRVDTFSYTMLYFQYAITLYLLFYLVYSFIATFTKSAYNFWYFAGSLILLLALLNDIGLANSKTSITRDYTSHIAAQIFVFVHAVMLIRVWIRAFIEKDELNREIEYLNKNLEKLVDQRTAELQDKNQEVITQNERINHQNELLRSEIEFKNRVFSIIAHDLKSPINSLLMFFSILKKDVEQSIRETALNSIHNLAISVNDLIDNLLYWGRSQGNQIPVKNKYIDLEVNINAILELFKEPASQKSIDLNYQKTINSMVFCDPELMQIVLRNLVSNSIKFCNQGGSISIRITSCKEDNSMAELTISDTGIGIPEEKLKALNEGKKIESTYGTAKEKGTGLGLNLCFDLVRLMKGKMSIRSKVNEGSVFTILIPVSQPHE